MLALGLASPGSTLAQDNWPARPIRLVIPEMYGYKSVKWVSRIELLARPRAGYWEQHGYDVDAWVGRSNGFVGFRS